MFGNKINKPRNSKDFLAIAQKNKEVDEIEKKAAIEGLGKYLQSEYLPTIMEIRRNFPVSDLDLLNINLEKNKSIDKQVKDNVSNLQQRMRNVIQSLTESIAERDYESTEEVIQNLDSFKEKETAVRLIKTEKEIFISGISLKIAVEMFLELNRQIIDRLNRSEAINDKQTARRMVVGNALLVYELLDFIIHYIEEYKMFGLSELRAIHKREQQEHQRLLHEEDILEHSAKSEDIDSVTREQTLNNISARRKTIEMLVDAWQNYMNEIEKRHNDASLVNAKIPDLILKRDDAKRQIEVLQAAAILGIVIRNVESLQAALESLENLELVTLSPQKVRDLLISL